MPPLLRGAFLAVCLTCGTAGHGSAAPRSTDPDWPCQQRLVPKLSASQFWNGPSVVVSEYWRQEPRVAALVETISPRNVGAERGKALIGEFAQGLGEDKQKLVTLAFTGLLEETNGQRTDLIERIKAFARRQRELADIATQAGEDLGKIPADAEGEAAERRRDLEQRRHYVSMAFQEAQRTLRYACEAPVQLEARLGDYARALQATLQ